MRMVWMAMRMGLRRWKLRIRDWCMALWKSRFSAVERSRIVCDSHAGAYIRSIKILPFAVVIVESIFHGKDEGGYGSRYIKKI